jgi:hypothetical protein
MAFVFLAMLAYMMYNGQIGKLTERLSVSSDITKISYGAGNMWLALVLVVVALALAAMYAVSIREWLQAMFKGRGVADPISMDSLVDPPTDLPPPPTGWPPRWDRMSNMNIAVIAVVVLVFLSGVVGGFYVKRGEDQSTSFNTGQPDEVINLDKLPDEQRTFPWTDYAAEGGTRTILWQADGTWFIKEMELVVTWTDESPIPRHQNMPDVFEVAIGSTTGENESAQGESSVSTLMGEVRIRIEFDNYIITTDLTGVEMPVGAVEGDINATVTCVSAGDEEPINVGVIIRPDDGNDFTAQLIVYYKLYERT